MPPEAEPPAPEAPPVFCMPPDEVLGAPPAPAAPARPPLAPALPPLASVPPVLPATPPVEVAGLPPELPPDEGVPPLVPDVPGISGKFEEPSSVEVSSPEQEVAALAPSRVVNARKPKFRPRNRVIAANGLSSMPESGKQRARRARLVYWRSYKL
nr:MAG: hypothetical protein DIU78_12595 [Pseudomonadota bacterium]